MSIELIISKLYLVSDQLNEIERSGFYTEREIDSKTYPLYNELENLQNQLYSIIHYKGIIEGALGLSAYKIIECSMLLSSIKNKINPAFHIEVVDAEILTPQMCFA